MKSAYESTVKKLLTYCAVGLVFLTACSPEKQYRVLSFFFDGVPNPNTTIIQTGPYLASDSEMVVNHTPAPPEFLQHKPYEEEKCNACHASDFSNRLLEPLPQLCYGCHTNFAYTKKVLHGPVASGNCIECHDQHMAKNDHLLSRVSQDMCFHCHEQSVVLASNKHMRIANTNCTDCHDPHGGENSGMLKAGTCTACHIDMAKQYAYVHGPVISGNCAVCHASHGVKARKLIARDRQQVCYYCHSQEQVGSSPAHKKINKMGCTECHSPHGGVTRYFLRSPEIEGRIHLQDSILRSAFDKETGFKQEKATGKLKQ